MNCLVAILQQPELFNLIEAFAAWYRPPIVADTRQVGIVAELGQTATTIHSAAAVGAFGYRWAARSYSAIRWVLEFPGLWTETYRLQQERYEELLADPDYVSTTP
jgi:hypothetical protein